MEHWNYSGVPPAARYDAVVDICDELVSALKAYRQFVHPRCRIYSGGRDIRCAECKRADAAIALAEATN